MKEEATCFTEEFYDPIIIKIILIIATVTRGNLCVKDIMCSGLSELLQSYSYFASETAS